MEVIRPQYLANNIVIVDGFSGAGKSLLMPLLSHYRDGEVWQLLMETERVCLLEYLNKIDYDSAKALVRMHFDQRIYELMLGRNVNLRASDDSSVQKSLLEEQYTRRMKNANERKYAVELIQQNSPLLIMDAHYIFGFSDLYLRSFDDRLSLYIFMKRNPTHLINAYYKQDIELRIANDPMEMTLTTKIDNKFVPYYAVSFYEEYIKANHLEKVILFVYHYHKMVDKMYSTLLEYEKSKFMYIAFENFATNPTPYIQKFSALLGKDTTDSFMTMYNLLELPRKEQEINYNLTFDLIEEQNLKIGMKYKNMIEEIVEEYKFFVQKSAL